MACTKICAFFFFFLIMASLGSSLAALYQVGDSAGWNSNGTNYQSWASTKTFYIGDAIGTKKNYFIFFIKKKERIGN